MESGVLSVDLHLQLVSAEGLPKTDLVGHSDPYFLLKLKENGRLLYRSDTIMNTASPVWDKDSIMLRNVPAGAALVAEVWDRDALKMDDFVGTAEFTVPSTQGPANLRLPIDLKAKHHGHLIVKLVTTAPEKPGAGALWVEGPVKYQLARSRLAGALMHSDVTSEYVYTMYKLRLLNIGTYFCRPLCPWNRKYSKAQAIFNHMPVQTMIRAQHGMLYSEVKPPTGVLNSGDEFLELIDYGLRGSEPRYFTYVILQDSMRFSETGASLFADFMSKHAMHAGCEPQVYYAGEFCVMRNDDGSYRLVIDNNSGTYAPDPGLLLGVATLLRYNLPGLQVETLDALHDYDRLSSYHSMVPSRLPASAAHAAVTACNSAPLPS